MSLLEIKNLKKHFDVGGKSFFGKKNKVHAVDNVSLVLKKHETLGIVGESGCGKSTLGRTILKLIEPSAGEIHYNGEDITHFPPRQMNPLRKKMQMIFQDPYASLNPRMSVNRIINEPLAVHNLSNSKTERDQRVDELLEMVGLPRTAKKKYPAEFSGGQRQRIMIARILATEPELVIADEAVSALDVSIQSQILNLISELREMLGTSYIFISHDLGVVKFISDRIAVMYLGTIVESAPSDVLYRNPLHPYSKSLLSSIPGVKRKRARKRYLLKGDVPSLVSIPEGCRFHTRCPEASEICRRFEPESVFVERDHSVMCHLYSNSGDQP
ncbi:ABC transporter ATP-binding protein [bacterium]|nr:ABC transporter ATP-binding protein [bacterium]